MRALQSIKCHRGKSPRGIDQLHIISHKSAALLLAQREIDCVIDTDPDLTRPISMPLTRLARFSSVAGFTDKLDRNIRLRQFFANFCGLLLDASGNNRINRFLRSDACGDRFQIGHQLRCGICAHIGSLSEENFGASIEIPRE